MKFTALLILLISAVPAFAFAETNIEVSGNAENSTNSVTIQNNTSSTVKNQDSSANVSTHIKVEANGEVKEINSDKPEDINYESDNGSVKIHVSNNITPPKASPSPTASTTPSPMLSPTITGTEFKNRFLKIIQKEMNFLKNLFFLLR